MRLRWPVPVMALVALFCCSRLGFASSGQNRASEREQRILQIQQLIQEHDLEKAHVELAEAAKQYPGTKDSTTCLVSSKRSKAITSPRKRAFAERLPRRQDSRELT